MDTTMRSGLRTARSLMAPRVIRGLRAAAGAIVGLLISGCFTYTPATSGDLAVQERAEFHLSDEGRVLLANQVGPAVKLVDGRIVGSSDSAWTVNVYRVENISGAVSTWSGESLVIPRRAVSSIAIRQVDRMRSVAASAVVTTVVAVFLLRGPLGGGDGFVDPSNQFPGGTTGESLRVP